MTDLNERQAEIEYESTVLGQTRYEAARLSNGESSTSPGEYQTNLIVPTLASNLEAWMLDAAQREAAGHRFKALPYLLHIDPTQAAYLATRYTLDGAALNAKVNTVAIAIGAAVEDHVNLVSLSEDAPGLYRKVMEQLKKSTSEHHRTGVLRHVMGKYGKQNLKWSNSDKLHLGMLLIEQFDLASTSETRGPLVLLVRNTEGRHNTPTRLTFSEAGKLWFDEAHSRAALWGPVHLPMLVPPRDWHTEVTAAGNPVIVGGYLTGAIRRARMVQSRLPGALKRLANGNMEQVYAAINAVQRTAWRINKPLLAVMAEARAGGPGLESLFVEADRPLPPRPASVPEGVDAESLSPEQREALLTWKRTAAEVYTSNGRLASKRRAVAQKLWCAGKFSDESAIYFPHYLDFRGRMYPFSSYLNPQSSDSGRAMLEFAEGKPLGERGLYWLKVHVANLFGVDKVSFDERVKWVNDHLDVLVDSAMSPLDGQMFWTTADHGNTRWCALAACMELAGALVQGNDYVSHLPIAMDGSCSGLQHYSAMLRDPVGGAAVNLVPASKPGDIYTEVAKRAQAIVDLSTDAQATPWKNGKVVRAVVKQPTMTLCYSATVFGMQGQIEKAVNGLGGPAYLGIEPASLRNECVYLAGHVWDAIGGTVVAARDAMEFMKEIAKLATEAGLPICWTAPSGFYVEQEYVKPIVKRVEVHYRGTRIDLRVADDGDKLDSQKQAAGIAPNFVHSLDSAHLMATVELGSENGLTSWACIHDSFAVHAADVDTLHACIRETFVEQYTPDVLALFREEIVAQLPPELAAKVPAVPTMGTLDLEAVRDATYFFA